MSQQTFAALADPTRRTIFELLVADGPCAVAQIAAKVTVSRPAVSQHLKVLVDAGLADVTPAGNRRLYRAAEGGLHQLRRTVEQYWDDVLHRFEGLAGKEDSAMSTTRHPPVVKQQLVPIDAATAFELFTNRLHEWWPTESHSISAGDDATVTSITFDGRIGGSVVEHTSDGHEYAWAEVTAWDPPRRFALSWHPSAAPTAASRLDVRFHTVPEGTMVVLEHTGWEEFGERGSQLRSNYDQGWDIVLGQYRQAARRQVAVDADGHRDRAPAPD